MAAFLLMPTSSAIAVEQSDVFSGSCISQVELSLPQSSIDALLADPRGEYQPGTLTFDACGAGTDVHGPVPVTLRLKGSISFRSLEGKAAFKIKFAKPDRLDKLKSFTLNNMVQDPASIREVLGYEAFGRLGIISARAGYAKLSLNGDDFGLYANVESIDDRFAEDNFSSTTHLYEAPDWREGHTTIASRDILPESVANFEVDEGDENDRSDLAAFAAINQLDDDEAWWDAFRQRTDSTSMLRVWAATFYLGITDLYPSATNNYYLHSDSANVFTMIPSGIDRTLQDVTNYLRYGIRQLPLLPEPSPAVLVDRCFGHPPCRNAYLDQLEFVARTVLESLDLVERVRELYALVSAAGISGRSEQTSFSQCASARDAVKALQVRAAEIDKLARHSFGWARISSTQSRGQLDCSAHENVHTEPAEPDAIPTDPLQPLDPVPPQLRVTRVEKLKSLRGGHPRYRLHVRTESPLRGRWVLRVHGPGGPFARRTLVAGRSSIVFQSRRQFIRINATGPLGRSTGKIKVRLRGRPRSARSSGGDQLPSPCSRSRPSSPAAGCHPGPRRM